MSCPIKERNHNEIKLGIVVGVLSNQSRCIAALKSEKTVFFFAVKTYPILLGAIWITNPMFYTSN